MKYIEENKEVLYSNDATSLASKIDVDFLKKKAKEEGVVKDSHLLISVTVPDLAPSVATCQYSAFSTNFFFVSSVL